MLKNDSIHGRAYIGPRSLTKKLSFDWDFWMQWSLMQVDKEREEWSSLSVEEDRVI